MPWRVPGSPGRCPTRSAASRASGATPARTCSRGSGSRASCSTPRSSTSRAGAATPSPSCPSSGPTSAARGCACGRPSRSGSCGTSSASRSSIVMSARAEDRASGRSRDRSDPERVASAATRTAARDWTYTASLPMTAPLRSVTRARAHGRRPSARSPSAARRSTPSRAPPGTGCWPSPRGPRRSRAGRSTGRGGTRTAPRRTSSTSCASAPGPAAADRVDEDIVAIVPLMHRHEVEPEDAASFTVLRRPAEDGTHVRPDATADLHGRQLPRRLRHDPGPPRRPARGLRRGGRVARGRSTGPPSPGTSSTCAGSATMTRRCRRS